MEKLFTFLFSIHQNIYRYTAILYMLLIYILSNINFAHHTSNYPVLIAILFNFFHFPLYMGLGIILLFSFRPQTIAYKSKWDLKLSFISLFILSIYGLFDEWHQSWTGRTCSYYDFYIDLYAGICALVLIKYYVEKSISLIQFIFIIITVFSLSLYFIIYQVF